MTPADDRNSLVTVWMVRPAMPTPELPDLVGRARVEIAQLVRIDCLILRHESGYRVRLAPKSGWDFAPRGGRRILRESVVKAWEAGPWANLS